MQSVPSKVGVCLCLGEEWSGLIVRSAIFKLIKS
jgi:hypothetical protein